MENDRTVATAADGDLTICPECDLLVREAASTEATVFTALCPRCGAFLHRHHRNGLENSLALALGALVLLVAGNAFPIVGLDIQGQRIETTVIGAAAGLWQEEMRVVAVLVLLTTTLLPLLELGAVLWMVLPLRLGRRPPGFVGMFRALRLAHPWAMVEVFILGLLVALVKLAHIAEVLPGAAAWCFGGLMLLLAALTVVIEPRDLWQTWAEARP
jgi:paraquat-inducible protein A